MTTGGDIIYGGGSGAPTRLANGTAGQVLQSNGTTLAPSWATLTGTSFANPTGSVGLTAVNGSAATWMRSDAAPALNVGIIPTWTGAHTWSALGTFNLGLNASGAAINLNASSNFNTNINTGTSTGAIAIGNAAGTGITQQVGTGNFSLDGTTGSTYIVGASTTTGTMTIGGTAQTGAITVGSSSAAQTLNLGTGAGAATVNVASGLTGSQVSIANGANSVAQTVNIGAGANAANNTINIGSGLNTAGVTAITIGSNQALANTTAIEGGNGATAITMTPQTTGAIVIGAAAGTGAITVGSSSAAQTLNLGTGAGAATVNVASGLAGSQVSIANGNNTSAQTINIGAGANGANNTINIGSGLNTAGVTAITIGSNQALANTTAIEGGNGATAITLTPQTTGQIVIGAAAGTGAVTLGASSATQIVNVGTGTGAATVNIATGATNAKAINIGTGNIANTILMGNATTLSKAGVNQGTPTAQLHLGASAGAANTAPLKFTSGTSVGTAEQGAVEYDGVNTYITNETTSGRGAIPVEQHFLLTASGGLITTQANFFGATSNPTLTTNGIYEIDVYCWYLKTTAAAVNWYLVHSVAPAAGTESIAIDLSPAGGISAPPGAATYLAANVYGNVTASYTFATASLTNAVTHYAHFKIILNNTSGSTYLKIQAATATGSITPYAGSRWYCKRLSASNVGNFTN